MKPTKMLTNLFLAGCFMLVAGQLAMAGPVGTAFTYQGRLIDANEAADGLYDFQFKLYDAAGDGNKLGTDVNKPEVDVIDGYFTVELDFGNVFDDNAIWLDIGVRPGDLEDPNVYTLLSPRQEITPTPYALYALGGGGVGADSDWIISGNDMYSGVSGNVGIGTTSPAAKLEVVGDISAASVYKIGGINILSAPAYNTFVGQNAGVNNTTGNYNTFSGRNAGYSNTTGSHNSAIGSSGLSSNTTGSYNSAVGYEVLYSNTEGNFNSAMGSSALSSNTTGSWNSAIGVAALSSNTTGSNNSAVGEGALHSNTTASNNSAVGKGALHSNTTGTNNSAMGTDALYSNTTGERNSAIGGSALYSNTTGNYNSAVGFEVLYSNTEGNFNSGIGSSALSSNTTGNWNSAMGVAALSSNTTGSDNAAVGEGALHSNTTASGNSAVGKSALYNNTTGYGNSAVGYKALYSNTTGAFNSAMGDSALSFNTTGYDNSAMGEAALYNNTTGYCNSAVGDGALSSNMTGYSNSAIGMRALYNNTTGHDNSAMGVYALSSNTTGNRNTAVGYYAGRLNEEGSGNVFLGHRAGYYEPDSNTLYIANSDVNPPLIYGDFSTGNVGLGTTSPAAKLEVAGQVKITGGSPANGKVLTSDSSGLATWQTLSGVTDGDWIISGSNMYSGVSGNVGIGTTDPGEEIHVKGSGFLQGIFESTDSSGGIQLIANNGQSYELQSVNDGGFIIYDRTDGRYCMKIDTSGNVGIGTITPARNLHVNDVMRLQPRATAPYKPIEGDIYMDSTAHKLMVYDGSAWQACW